MDTTIEFEQDFDGVEVDRVAARTEAYCQLLSTVDKLKNAQVRAEGMKMLDVVRRTVKLPRTGEVVALPSPQPAPQPPRRAER